MKKTFILFWAVSLIFSLCSCEKAVESISLDKSKITIERAQTFKLNATVLPSNADNKELAWSIDGDSVRALTDENSPQKEFTGEKTGTSTIKVIASNGCHAECTVNVIMNAEDSAKEEAEAKIAAEEKAKEDAQYLINGDVKVKLKDPLPITIKQFSSLSGSLVRKYQITKVQAEGNDIYVSGTKLSDIFGNEFGCKVKWQLSDDTGAVVTSDWTLSPATAVGESWANVNIRFKVKSLPAGVYTLQFCDSD